MQSKIVFKPSQEKVMQEAIKWFHNSSEQTFEIAGEAGTGKSVVLAEIISRLGLGYENVYPMAYTGQAAIVMRMKGFGNAKSIHSTLYEAYDVYENDNMDPFYNRPKKKRMFRKKPKSVIPKSVQLFAMDEAFLTPDHMRKDIESFGRKVIAVGDDGQLPPVGGKPAYFGGYGVHRLVDIMRQEENNPIIYLAHRARKGLPIHCGMYGKNVLVIPDTEIDNYILSVPQVIICYTNDNRNAINRYVRKYIKGIESDLPVFGDRVICRENNWEIEVDNVSLTNGLCGTVMSAPNVGTFSGETFSFDFAPDLSSSCFYNLKANYKYFKEPASEVKEEMKKDPYLEGEKFESAYALTVYLSQGAEYHTPMYIEEMIRPDLTNAANYTGITRAKQNLIYVKPTERRYFANTLSAWLN